MERHTLSKHTAYAFLAIIILCSGMFSLGIFSSFQNRLSDTVMGGKAISEDIIIVAIDDASLQEVGRWPWKRTNFSLLIQQIGEPSVVGIDVAFLEPTEDDTILAQEFEGKKIILVSEYTKFDRDRKDVKGRELLLPAEDLRHIESGYANIVADTDGIVRSVNLDLGDEEALSQRIAEEFSGIDMEKKQRFLIDFHGAPGSFLTYSASDVINGRIDKEKFQGKIVLVGATAQDLHDTAIVPTSEGVPMAGVEIQANAIQTMLFGEPRKVSPIITMGTMILFGLIIIFMLLFLPAWVAGVCSVALAILYAVMAILLYEQGFLLNMLYPPMTGMLLFVAIALIDLFVERREKRFVMDAFGKYVSPALLKDIMQKKVELGGERRRITILFSDIRGFTSVSEKLTPEELVDFLNEYFADATKEIMEHRGLVDKFIGDAVMAFWNAPLSDDEHERNACLSAIALRDVVSRMRAKGHTLAVGVGVNTGDAVVGNLGSRERLDYTAIGDSVNLASRLEGLTKKYGVDIIISEETRRRIGEDIVVRELDRVRVKGKSQAIKIFEVAGRKESVSAKEMKNIVAYEKALEKYYAGRWKEASQLFGSLTDETAKMMRERCLSFAKTKPKNWDGTFSLTSK